MQEQFVFCPKIKRIIKNLFCAFFQYFSKLISWLQYDIIIHNYVDILVNRTNIGKTIYCNKPSCLNIVRIPRIA